MHKAKTHLSKYVEKALAGEEVILARDGEPIVALVPIAAQDGEKRNNVILGVLEGVFKVPDDFDMPLPEEMLNELQRETDAIC